MTEVSKVPEQCMNCPILSGVISELVIIKALRYYVEDKARELMDDDTLNATVDAIIDANDLDPDRRDSYKRILLQETGKGVEELDLHVDVLEQTRDEMTATCVGAFTMRAFNRKDNNDYKVTVCTSVIQYEGSDNIAIVPGEAAPDRDAPTVILTEARIERSMHAPPNSDL